MNYKLRRLIFSELEALKSWLNSGENDMGAPFYKSYIQYPPDFRRLLIWFYTRVSSIWLVREYLIRPNVKMRVVKRGNILIHFYHQPNLFIFVYKKEQSVFEAKVIAHLCHNQIQFTCKINIRPNGWMYHDIYTALQNH